MSFWKKVGKSIMAVAALLNIRSDKVCYKDHGIGCFSNADPFDNASGKLPLSPKEIDVKFHLFTRHNIATADRITKSKVVLDKSHYKGSRKTKFIIHGFRDDGRASWIKRITKALLDKEDVNVIVVDWEKGADGRSYSQAASNTRVVGALIAQLMKSLVLYKKARTIDMHLIGHSLGAHIAGYAGARTPGTGRISGLDPAGLHFSSKAERVRLDPKDALFVDVIHTDGEPVTTLGFGTSKPMGHVDFYPNDGENQPGCKSPPKLIPKIMKGKFKEFTRGISCSHSRVKDLYIESISSSCAFPAHRCKSYSDYLAGRCPCEGRCVAMGYKTKSSVHHGKYYLKTNSQAPYCRDV